MLLKKKGNEHDKDSW